MKKEELLRWLSQAKWYHPPSDQKERKSNRAYKEIVALIEKPQVTEGWIEAKAIELNYLSIYSSGRNQRAFAIGRTKAEDFIRSLVEELK